MQSQHANKILATKNAIEHWLSNSKRPLVFTNGCFDLLHRGHVTYLEEAASLGATMIVALNSDQSVRSLGKNPDRPLNKLDDRMAVMASLACVDAVCSFDEPTPLALIELIKPEHLVKGGDWPVEKIVGFDEVNRAGGQVHSIEFKHPNSTTALVEKIRNS